MASLSQIWAHIYTITLLFFSIIILQVAIIVHAADRLTRRRSLTTHEFLKIVDKKVPARPFKKTGLLGEPVECRVCLSLYEEGDEVRNLKCKHTFHKACLDMWLQQDDATCPLCRQAVLPPEVVDKHRNHRFPEFYDDGIGSDEELMLMLYTLHHKFMRRFL